MKTLDLKKKTPYVAPVMESVAIRIEEGILVGSQKVRGNVAIETMDMDDPEIDW